MALGKGLKVPEVCRQLGVSEQTYYRWRTKYGGMDPLMAKQMKELEKENARLKKLLTPTEARRLMGFPADKKIVVSDTQAYKQFGNAVVPPVAEAVAGQIAKVLRRNLLEGPTE